LIEAPKSGMIVLQRAADPRVFSLEAKHMKPLLILAVAMTLTPYPVAANPVERACLQSDRAAANRALCTCIGRAADMTLSRSDMRQGARFFDDPQRAQDVRMSNRASDERLWDSWRNFGETAEAMCS
jgi:hypothetical protein